MKHQLTLDDWEVRFAVALMVTKDFPSVGVNDVRIDRYETSEGWKLTAEITLPEIRCKVPEETPAE